jgi:phosphate transport system substrate-binding protein
MRNAAILLGSLAAALAGCRPPERAAGPEIVLRLHGSNTIGAKLAPAFARAWFRSRGADSVWEVPGANPEESSVHARLGGRERVAEIASHGSNTGFNDLAWGKCDIALSSKPIDAEAAQRLAALGDMRAPECEHVIGLDGIALIVHPGNPLGRVSVAQAAALFAGKARTWGEAAKGVKGPVHLYSRDHNSGTFEVFRADVLGGGPISDSARICESNQALAAAVAADPQGLGYVPAGALGAAKPLAISGGEAPALPPTKTSIATEDYALSRRLFFYTSAHPANPEVADFIAFAQSDAGQARVEECGFVAQTLRAARPALPEGAPAGYLAEVRDAVRLSLDFRFRPGSADLDGKARADLARLARFVEEERLRPCQLKLLGFCDNVGAEDRNRILSRERAQVVAAALQKEYGLPAARVSGFGSALPVADNSAEAGRQRNRRIEVWLSCATDLAAAELGSARP